MTQEEIYRIVCSAVGSLVNVEEGLKPFPAAMDRGCRLADFGFDVFLMGGLERELESRLDGRVLNLSGFAIPEQFFAVTVGDLVDHLLAMLTAPAQNPLVVYVDDEEENLFVFSRKFGQDFRMKTFLDPVKALAFISSESDVRLVVTDEVMPVMRGNELCDAVREVKPYMKFILITGNPESDDNLMYKTLRHNRFYEFIQKPVNFDKRHDEYVAMIKRLII